MEESFEKSDLEENFSQSFRDIRDIRVAFVIRENRVKILLLIGRSILPAV